MEKFLHDMIHMTQGEKLIHYWWLWLMLLGVAFSLVYVKWRKVNKNK